MHPPDSLDELRQLVADMQNGTASTRLGKRSYKTLVTLIDAPDHTALNSISKIADSIHISPSTLTRLAKRLGYQGFSEFQQVFRQHLASGEGFYSRRAGLLLDDDRNVPESWSLVAKVAEDEQRNTADMLGNIDPEALLSTADMLAQSRLVRIHGLRQFFSLACFFSYGLGLIRSDVDVLGDAGHGVAHALAQMEEGDTLVVLGSEPYTRANVDACRIAASHDLNIIAITDSFASPLAAAAKYKFIVPTAGRYYSNSTASWFILIEGLLTLVAKTLGHSAIQALRKREQLFQEMGVSLSMPKIHVDR